MEEETKAEPKTEPIGAEASTEPIGAEASTGGTITEEERQRLLAEEKKKKRMNPLREALIERSRKILEDFTNHMKTVREPTTVAEIANTIGANRVTVAKHIAQSIHDGNPYKLKFKRVGMYEIIWRDTEPEPETEAEA